LRPLNVAMVSIAGNSIDVDSTFQKYPNYAGEERDQCQGGERACHLKEARI
jgi:hypothetical protein